MNKPKVKSDKSIQIVYVKKSKTGNYEILKIWQSSDIKSIEDCGDVIPFYRAFINMNVSRNSPLSLELVNLINGF